ncbi:MAG: TatD family hydrolase [Ferruginibacter sp.]|nr:TatD family hydrolase [Ferruginibacter sp.]
MSMIDSHCHLYVEEFMEDIAAVIARANNEGVNAFYLPAIDSSSTAGMLALEEQFPGMCRAMMGLHPCYVKENVAIELDKVHDWLSKRTFAAVGEIGLDFYWDVTYRDEQFDAFHKQIEWALQFQLPIVIHSRQSTRECIDVIAQYSAKGLKGIFHCFGGTRAEAEEIIGHGFLLGIGGVVTYKNSKLAEVLKDISLEHIVLETDAPYLTPVPFRGKRNEPAYLKFVAEKIAEIHHIDVATVQKITSANALKVFK